MSGLDAVLAPVLVEDWWTQFFFALLVYQSYFVMQGGMKLLRSIQCQIALLILLAFTFFYGILSQDYRSKMDVRMYGHFDPWHGIPTLRRHPRKCHLPRSFRLRKHGILHKVRSSVRGPIRSFRSQAKTWMSDILCVDICYFCVDNVELFKPWLLWIYGLIFPYWEYDLKTSRSVYSDLNDGRWELPSMCKASLSSPTKKSSKTLKSATMSDVDKLLRCAPPLEQFRLYQQFGMNMFQLGSERTMFQRAFIATADLLRDVQFERPPDAAFKAGYIMQSDGEMTPIVFDTGCSFSLTPFFSDFTQPLEKTEVDNMKGLSKDPVQVQGVGWVEWPIRDVFGKILIVRTKAFYVPQASMRLMSPQMYFREQQGGNGWFDQGKLMFCGADGDYLQFPYDWNNNIPHMYLDKNVPQAGLSSADIQNVQQAFNLENPGFIEQAHNLLDDNNFNLTKSQKEVLLWHLRLCHMGFHWLQSLMRKRKNEHGEQADPPVIPTKVQGTTSVAPPKCAACQLGKQHRRTTGSTTVTTKPGMEMAIRSGDLRPGDRVSMDQCVCKIRGRLPHTFGKEHVDDRYCGGTLFVDHASGYIFLKNQISLRVGETLQGKHAFERFADHYGIKLRSFHADNHPFGALEFIDDLELQGQSITFSGVGAHHMNGVAERALKTCTLWARCAMMHQLLHWPSAFQADLWPFAMEHAVHIWNSLPREGHSMTPTELFTGLKQFDHQNLLRSRVWGCPTFVLDPKLQDGKKLPKWTKRSRQGVYLGCSPTHSSNVGRILSLSTGAISPQFHVVHDELYSTVSGTLLEVDSVFDPDQWKELLRLDGWERYTDLIDPQDPLAETELQPFEDNFEDFLDDDSTTSSVPEGEETDVSDSDDDEEGTFEPEHPVPEDTVDDRYRTRSGRRVTPTVLHSRDCGHGYRPESDPPYIKGLPQFRRDAYLAGANPRKKIKSEVLQNQFVQGLTWDTVVSSLRSKDSQRSLLPMLKSYDPMTKTLEDGWSPMALAAKANDADTPNWNQAMNGPNAKGFREACKTEIDTLNKMNVWDVVPRQSWMNVLPSTWAFKIKRLPDLTLRKLKARFCARGDCQIDQVDFFDACAPVVCWTTVRLMLVLAIELKLANRQVDYTAAFVHADIDKPPNFDEMSPEEQSKTGVYVQMPRGFEQPGMVLKLNKSLYGLRQSPKNWFDFLKSQLEDVGFEQALDVDPCLFISDKVICLVYVDDSLFFTVQRELHSAYRRGRSSARSITRECNLESNAI